MLVFWRIKFSCQGFVGDGCIDWDGREGFGICFINSIVFLFGFFFLGGGGGL